MKKFPASNLLVSLYFLISLSFTIFFFKEDIISSNEFSLNFKGAELNLDYASNKIIPTLSQTDHCSQIVSDKDKAKISFVLQDKILFQYHCKRHSLFKHKLPTKKYYDFSNIEDVLDLTQNQQNVFSRVKSFADFPQSSEDSPKIVLAENELEGNLLQPFYGIVITHSKFNLINGRMFGVLYSGVDNDGKDRNIKFSKVVVSNLEKSFSYWYKLDHSHNRL